MKAKLIDSSNLLMLRRFKGVVGEFRIAGGAAYLIQTYSERFHTSMILHHEQVSENIVVLHTLNSEYTFEIIEGTFDPEGIVAVDDLIVEQHKRMNEEKYRRWFCQIGGVGFLEGAISTVTLPEPMDKADAMAYIADNNLSDDSEGCLVIALRNPVETT